MVLRHGDKRVGGKLMGTHRYVPGSRYSESADSWLPSDTVAPVHTLLIAMAIRVAQLEKTQGGSRKCPLNWQYRL